MASKRGQGSGAKWRQSRWGKCGEECFFRSERRRVVLKANRCYFRVKLKQEMWGDYDLCDMVSLLKALHDRFSFALPYLHVSKSDGQGFRDTLHGKWTSDMFEKEAGRESYWSDFCWIRNDPCAILFCLLSPTNGIFWFYSIRGFIQDHKLEIELLCWGGNALIIGPINQNIPKHFELC